MKPLRNLMDKIGEATKGNRFAHTVYDGIETFLFAPNHTTRTSGGVHIKDGIDLKRTMFHVVIALQLCFIHGLVNIGHQHYLALGMFPDIADGILEKAIYGLIQILPIVIIVHIVGLGIEFFYAARKGHSIEEGFLVSGMLIPLIMPPDVPLWMVSVATAFAVIIGKEAFGGTGMNILNVALTARVFIFFAYPTYISGDTCWVAYDYSFLHEVVNSLLPGDFLQIGAGTAVVDGFSGATPLALAAQGGMEAVYTKYSSVDLLLGFIPGSIGEVNKLGVIAGVGILILTGIGSWRIMLSMVLGLAFMSGLFNMFAADFPDAPFLTVPFYNHMMMGSFLFAMAFMATDPVTAAQTNVGKVIYGFLIGAVGLIVRVANPAYPEGWMLAILLLNVLAPLIDHYVIDANINRRLKRAESKL